jgi:hypothetical protein
MEEVILLIIPYLSDLYKIRLLSTCSTFRALIPRIQFTGLYDYSYVKHLPFIHNFLNVQFRFSLDAYVLLGLREHEGFSLGRIPQHATIIYWRSDIKVTSVLNDENCRVHTLIMERYARFGRIPKNIKTIIVCDDSEHCTYPEGVYIHKTIGIWYNSFARLSDFNYTPFFI